jgi:hypothetical protein
MAPETGRRITASRPAARAVLLALSLLPLGAGAQLYVCKTPSGKTLSQDQPPAECKDTVIRLLNRDGTVKSIIEPPMTPEQKQARDAEDRRRHEREMQAQDQLRKDRALLETYGSEEEIEAVRNRTLAVRQTAIEHANQQLKEYRDDRKHLEEEAEFYSRRSMPDKLKRQLKDNTDLQELQHHSIEDIRLEMEHINERYDADLRRYRELVLRGATPVARKNDP